MFILLGAIILLLKHKYDGPYVEFVKSYLGNVSVSFAVYFLASFYAYKMKWNKISTVFVTLLTVELFEITNGFGIMKNTFDSYDFIANVLGVFTALVLDLSTNNK